MPDMPPLTLGARPDVRADITTRAINSWDASLRAAVEDEASISILDPIGADMWGEGVTAKRIEGALRRIGGRAVTVKINSPGGDVFEGGAIYELLRQHSRDRGPVSVHVLGLAGSAASIIAMAGDEVLIGRSAFFMIHNSWVIAAGNRNTFAEVAEWLAPFDEAMAEVYTARTGQDRDKIAAMMDRETWLTAARSVELGFADGYLDGSEVAHAGADAAAREHLRAEKRFDLVAARAGIGRNDARGLLRDLKGDLPGAVTTGLPGAADIEAELAELLADLKS
ncbi:Clp protease [Mameliella alba]|uniref:head maturation protease, ClpP-related n=1 Tax=Mameliella alba TaxID=561184 RepID=UPI00088990EE|nr:head maturation protease, ClpP-related [Mameliella alba]OWV41894.1 peptidase [Mameliella alba]PTR35545.1 ClpP protease-like protein [Mameliella alba]GGF82800.1 ATP-dependent Clp protease proteolytic subunit [Mameliella alba]SDE20400.1 Clp protease [Mameliella alba]